MEMCACACVCAETIITLWIGYTPIQNVFGVKKRIKLNFKNIGRKCKGDACNAWVRGPS